jgi:hypothetical protein
LGLVILVAVPAFFINRFLLKQIDPRRSVLRFLLYVTVSLAAALVFTFAFVWLMLKFMVNDIG